MALINHHARLLMELLTKFEEDIDKKGKDEVDEIQGKIKTLEDHIATKKKELAEKRLKMKSLQDKQGEREALKQKLDKIREKVKEQDRMVQQEKDNYETNKTQGIENVQQGMNEQALSASFTSFQEEVKKGQETIKQIQLKEDAFYQKMYGTVQKLYTEFDKDSQ